jgi:isocitrate dehydrogenase kinase/phosphatase
VESRVFREFKAIRVPKVSLEHKVCQVPQDLAANKVNLGFKAFRVLKAHLERRAVPVIWVLQAVKDPQVRKDRLVPLDRKDRLERRAAPAP